jgi:hypothetical protein
VWNLCEIICISRLTLLKKKKKKLCVITTNLSKSWKSIGTPMNSQYLERCKRIWAEYFPTFVWSLIMSLCYLYFSWIFWEDHRTNCTILFVWTRQQYTLAWIEIETNLDVLDYVISSLTKYHFFFLFLVTDEVIKFGR